MKELLWVLQILFFFSKKPRGESRTSRMSNKKVNDRLRQVLLTSRCADEIKSVAVLRGFDNTMDIDSLSLIEKRAIEREKYARQLNQLMHLLHQEKQQCRDDVSSLVIKIQEVVVGGLTALTQRMQYIKTIRKGVMGDDETAHI